MPKAQITHIILKHGQMIQKTDEISYHGHYWGLIDERYIGATYRKDHQFQVRRPVRYTTKKKATPDPKADAPRYMLLKQGDVLCGGDEGFCLHHLEWKPVAPIFIGCFYDQIPASIMRRPMPVVPPIKEKMVFFDGEQHASISITFSKTQNPQKHASNA